MLLCIIFKLFKTTAKADSSERQCCQVAISVARFDQTWLYWDPPGYFILFLATGKILAISWLFGKEALKRIFSLMYLP